MKTSNQPLLIILAIIFSVALSLTVALICLAASPEKPLSPTPVPSDTSKEDKPADDEKSPDPTYLVCGLQYEKLPNGNCRIVGMGICTDACLTIPEQTQNGEPITEIASQAFFGNEILAAVQIPKSITSIGTLAFGDCPNLVYVSVSEENSAYLDDGGILYTKDYSTLLLYPSRRGGNPWVLPKEVKTIEEMAVCRCPHLSMIHYAGSAEEWEEIQVGSKNYALSACAKLFLGD